MDVTPVEKWALEKTCIGSRSRELLEEYQLGKIRETVDYAKTRSRFYGERMKKIRADDIRCPDDLQKIPFTFPQDVQKDPFAFLCVPQSDVKRIVTLNTTGTSGSEKRVFFTEEDMAASLDFFIAGLKCFTETEDRVMVLLPGASYGSIGDLLKRGREKMGAGCYVPGIVTDYEKTANEIMENDINCLIGIPSQILYLSRIRSETFGSRIKTVLLSADFVPEALIRELTDLYGCRVFTHYGMTEMGYGGGIECGALNGYHMREADLYFEIVDPVTGGPVPDGQWGEAVFTTLNRKAMPLIRYRTGDMAAFSDEACPCGTFLKTMKRVRGRLDNRISLRDRGYLYLNELDEVVLPFREVLEYKARISGENRLSIEILTGNENDFLSIKDAVAGRVRQYIDVKSGGSSELEVSVVRKTLPEKIKNSMVKRTFENQQ